MDRRALRLATELVIAVAIVDEIPVSGAPPPADVPIVDGYHEDYPEQVFANNQAQRDAWLASDTFVATVVAESNERLPIDTPSLSGTATATSTATGTLAVTALVEPEPTEPVLRLVWQKPPPDTLYDPHIASLANDLPFAPASLSGSAASTSSASGTVSIGALVFDDPQPVPPAPGGSVDPPPEELPVNSIALGGTATAGSSASGTLARSAFYPEDIGPDFVLSQRPADSSALLLAVSNAEEIPVDGTVAEVVADVFSDELPLVTHAPIAPLYVEGEELPVSPVALSGTATSASSATGTLAASALYPEDIGPDFVLSQRPVDSTPLLAEIASATEIPESGAAPVAGDEVPDDPVPIVGHVPGASVPVQDAELPVAPVALSGTATATSTASGSLSVSALVFDDPQPVRAAPAESAPVPPEELPVTPVAISGGASSTSSATGTIGGSALLPEPDALPTPAPMAAAEADRTEPVFQPVALSGSAVSTSTATGALSVGSLPLPEDGPLSAPQEPSFDLVAHVAASDGLVDSGAAAASVPADVSGTNFAVYPTTGTNRAVVEATGANAALYSALGANRAAFPTTGDNFEVSTGAGELEP